MGCKGHLLEARPPEPHTGPQEPLADAGVLPWKQTERKTGQSVSGLLSSTVCTQRVVVDFQSMLHGVQARDPGRMGSSHEASHVFLFLFQSYAGCCDQIWLVSQVHTDSVGDL